LVFGGDGLKAIKMNGNDLAFDGFDFVLATGDDELLQQIREILSVNLNEWFLNLDHGIDFQLFFQKPMNQELIQTSIIQKVQELEQIATVEITSFEYDARIRKPTILFTATKVNGEVVEGGI
jgi:hypothetical protein